MVVVQFFMSFVSLTGCCQESIIPVIQAQTALASSMKLLSAPSQPSTACSLPT